MTGMKTAAYLCKGCGIGERISATQMAGIATKEGKMNLVREHDFLCNAAGVQLIRDDIEKEAVTHVMIAACSRRAKTEAFQFPTVALARANIREGVIWSQPDTPEAKETTQEMADDYVRMGCAEVKKMQLPAGNPGVGVPTANAVEPVLRDEIVTARWAVTTRFSVSTEAWLMPSRTLWVELPGNVHEVPLVPPG